MPISNQLCNDPVSIVRYKAAKRMYALVLALSKDPNHFMCIVMQIRGFSQSTRFTQR